MKTLVLDTAWKNMLVGLYEDGRLVAGSSQEAFKKQSEILFVELKKQLEQAGWKLQDVDEVIITDGPGSYTGLRIAMTAAKILGTQGKIKVRTLSTLQLYAGADPCANVILDARGGRVYAGCIENGKEVWKGILPLEQVDEFLAAHPGTLYGEGELIGKSAKPTDFLASAQALIDLARPVEDVDTLVPVYMKESARYLP